MNPLAAGHEAGGGGPSGGPSGGGGGRSSAVKNRAAAPIQISAEQLLREAKERVDAPASQAPKVHIEDQEELDEMRLSKRRQFEDSLRMQRQHVGTWLKYAKFEESQKDFRRMRSVFERAIDVDYKNIPTWLKYAEAEMKNGFVNHARNVWDRAVTLLPRVDNLWYKYAYMEEMLGNVDGARQIFARWLQWEPDDHAFTSAVRLEERAGERGRARTLLDRYVNVHPTLKAYLKYAKWEERQGDVPCARRVFERAFEELPVEEQSTKLFASFAEFEARHQEHDRARAVYKFALEALPPAERESQAGRDLLAAWTSFEKRFGSRAGIEDVLVQKRRNEYEAAVQAEPLNYDAWFDFVRLEEAAGDAAKTRFVYERAIGNVPPVAEKRYWRRYIYLWINYALFMELDCDDQPAAREVLRACLRTVPHEQFTFGKIWLMLAKLEIRMGDVPQACKTLGQAIGRCPKDSIFRGYVALQMQLGNVDACRQIYIRWLAFNPAASATWSKFCELERMLGEEQRCRALFEQAIGQQVMDAPERLWKEFIDYEISVGQPDRARALYERLLQRTQHVKVWISFAQFEGSAAGAEAARARFQEAYDSLKRNSDVKEDRVLLLDAWLAYCEASDAGHAQTVRDMMPRKIPKKRLLTADDGSEAGWEEYYDYLFPDDESASSNLKILEMAAMWKRKRAEGE